MQTTITPADMKALEARFMAEYHVPSALLMEHAAQGVCAAMRRYAPQGRALFLCGPGNNGGDGYAAARLWIAQGGQAAIAELTDALSGDAAMNRRLALDAGAVLRDDFIHADIIVDALFGTGLNKPVQGRALTLICQANATDKPIIAVDIPSGLNGLTGEALDEAVRATETVTFHRPKPGLVLRDGAAFTGKLTVQPILIPKDYGSASGMQLLHPDDLALIPPRAATAHKGDLGRVVILAGSPGMAGAAAFAANAALKTGAGLATLLCRAELLPILQVLAPGATCRILPEAAEQAAALCREALSSADAAIIGPGLGTHAELMPLVEAFRQAPCPVVWDADALTLLAAHDIAPLPVKDVVTPHPGEAARLLHATAAEITREPLAALENLRQRLGCTVLLKGARTLMTDGRHTAVNLHGTPAMAKGGSGDVLTGILAALLARRTGLDTLTLTQLAALIHGLAGLRTEAIHGENGVGPMELIQHIRLDDKGL